MRREVFRFISADHELQIADQERDQANARYKRALRTFTEAWESLTPDEQESINTAAEPLFPREDVRYT